MKRTLIRMVLFVFVCQALMGAIAYAHNVPNFDDEGFPWPVGEPDTTLPIKPPTTEVSATTASTTSLIPVDLCHWNREAYLPVSGNPAPDWYVDGLCLWACEHYNCQPSMLYSDFSALWTALEVYVYSTSSDDDYFGLAAGFQPGDTSNTSAEYILIDWKRRNQWWDFSPCTPGSTAYAGLAACRVFGIPTADEFWGHLNFDAVCSDLNNGLEKLTRANKLGNVGWWYDPIHFRLEYAPKSLKVYVDGTLEFDISGTFGDGRWAFYDFSQPSTYFVDPRVEALLLHVDIDIKPGSYPNSINPNAGGVIPVAILTTDDFDARTVDPETVTLDGAGPRGKGKSGKYGSMEDVDGDGDLDLVVQIENVIEWVPDATEATLIGMTWDGISIEGTDSVNLVPSGK